MAVVSPTMFIFVTMSMLVFLGIIFLVDVSVSGGSQSYRNHAMSCGGDEHLNSYDSFCLRK